MLQSVLVAKEVAEQLQERLTAAEEALAAKQNHIDDMKQEMFKKEEELGTISVFKAQVSCCEAKRLSSISLGMFHQVLCCCAG